MRDIVFLFGAGASYGAGGIVPERPPLGFQLYEILERIYPGSWGGLPDDLRSTFRSNFEDGMGIVYQEYGGAISKLMREMAVYFVQFRPIERRSLYSKLIDRMRDLGLLERAVLSSLNYECVLEYALLNAGVEFEYFPASDPDPRLPVWKLHGSCNMFSENLRVGQGISYGVGISFEGGIRAYLDTNRVIEECLVLSGLAPVMCLFMEGKPLQVSPSAIKMTQEKWKERVMNSLAVVCIGANPLPEDAHIWGPLSKTNAQLYYVGAEQPFMSWVSSHRAGPSEFIAPYFHTGFDHLVQILRDHATV